MFYIFPLCLQIIFTGTQSLNDNITSIDPVIKMQFF
jgi:hypothetical protein